MIVDACDEAKLPILLNSLSHDALDIFDGLPEPKNTLRDVIAGFSSYFGEKSSVLLRRKPFLRTDQQMNESITEFACRLHRLARDCDFGDKATEMLHDIFVVGVRDDRLGERLLSEDATTWTFEDAIKRAEAFEHARAERNHSQVTSAVQAPVQSGRDKLSRDSLVKNNKKSRLFHDQAATAVQCFRCGSSGHLANSSSCRARTLQCRN